MKNNYFESGAFLGNGLGSFAMSATPTQLLESALKPEPAPAPAPEPVPVSVPAPAPAPAPAFALTDAEKSFLESRRREKTVEDLHQLILEAAGKDAMKNALSNAADAVFAWADGGDHSFDALDGFVQAAAGITDDNDDPTDEQVDVYNNMWGNVADFLAACGVDDDSIELLADDEDDDAAASVASAVAGIDTDDRDEVEAAFVVAGSSDDDMLTEAFKKVVRNGEIKLIRKPLRKRIMSSAQKAALKKARLKSHTGAAKMARKKSMKIHLKRLG